MPAQHQLVGRAAVGLLLIVMTGACSALGPDLHVGIDNTAGPKSVTVTLDSSGPGSGREVVEILPGTGVSWRSPLATTWEVKVDGRHVIGSSDTTGFARSSDFPWQDVMIRMQIGRDGAVKLLDAP
jgi:hypothetical protein